MKVFLMYKDHDFDVQQELPWNEPELTQDLELDTLFNAMALGDYYLQDAVKKVIFAGLKDGQDSILYRQSILKDCLKNPVIVRNLYKIAEDAMETKQKNHWGWLLENSNPAYVMSVSVGALQMFVGSMKQLRALADEHADKFESDGFKTLFAMIKKELDAPYFTLIQNHLRRLEFHHGILIGAELGRGNEGTNYILRKPLDKKLNLMQRLFTKKSPVYSFRIETRDEGGSKALEELRNKGIKSAVNAVAQSADHIDSFFSMLRFELGFYVGCLNLHEQLMKISEPASFPEPAAVNERQHAFSGLYDICLALTVKRKVVSNDVNADKKDLVIITGANQGGKSTFLRSIGLSQMMMQCGMFTPAETFTANVCDGLFTHFKREEDITMESGKLDEELKRTSRIVDRLTLNSMVLFNESFAATNEREGSEIARQITMGLVEKGIKVFFVTHQYEFAHGLYDRKMVNAIFLRADREADGTRTYKLSTGEPLQTSYGEDLYKRIFVSEKT
jgi:DNA mismatch repair ATPase MutS